MELNSNIIELPGIGEAKKKYFKKLNIENIYDLLTHYPFRYEDRSTIKRLKNVVDGEKSTFKLTIKSYLGTRRIKGYLITSFLGEDETASCEIIFFNSPFTKNLLKENSTYIFYGKIKKFRGKISLNSPKFEAYGKKKEMGYIYPIYKNVKGLNNKDITKAINYVLDNCKIEENLPNNLIKKYRLLDRKTALSEIHFPTGGKNYIRARQRLVFEEFLIFLLTVNSLKKDILDTDITIDCTKGLYDFINRLPFELTTAQRSVIDEIRTKMDSKKLINYLIQGDVGCGKTVVVQALMYLMHINGYQSTLMAPTEVLAIQHFNNFLEVFKDFDVKIALLTGKTTDANKRKILTELKNHDIDMLIGTHALIEDEVVFKNLGLTVVDEQHRFGVMQRRSLNEKSKAHMIVMSATPIPRTLGLILYADMDIAVIDTMPSDRKEVKTSVIRFSMLENAKSFMKREILNGRQVFVVCPLIEENEKLDELNSVNEVFEDLSSYFKDFRVKLLHGRMKSAEKEEKMKDFADGKIDLIVSTTVIEVGINVPNASVMCIYNAERFGLAQLHQLRGRVGRGEYPGYCILINGSFSEASYERLSIMEKSNDGFYIAQKDMELRGTGDMLGTRQHGDNYFKIADPVSDFEILKYANMEAKEILKSDPYLIDENYKALREELHL